MPGATYFGPAPEKYRDFYIGIERIEDMGNDFFDLVQREWAEVGDDQRFGLCEPNVRQAIQAQDRGNFVLFTVRRTRTFELVGYMPMTVSNSYKMQAAKMAGEIAVYIRPDAREGRLAFKLIDFAEKFMARFGVNAMVIGHRPGVLGDRIGRVYKRMGYEPVAVEYAKVLK